MREYVDAIWAEGCSGDLEAARRWNAILRRKARVNHDLRAQILGRLYEAIVFHFYQGDLLGKIRLLLENFEPIEKAGFRQAKCDNMNYLAWLYQFLGELDQAERYDRLVLEPCREINYRERYADTRFNTATVLFAHGLRAEGLPILDKPRSSIGRTTDPGGPTLWGWDSFPKTRAPRARSPL